MIKIESYGFELYIFTNFTTTPYCAIYDVYELFIYHLNSLWIHLSTNNETLKSILVHYYITTFKPTFYNYYYYSILHIHMMYFMHNETFDHFLLFL